MKPATAQQQNSVIKYPLSEILTNGCFPVPKVLVHYDDEPSIRNGRFWLAVLPCLPLMAYVLKSGLIVLIAAVGFLALRGTVFPFLRRPAIELSNTTLVWRQTGYFPTKIQRIDMHALTQLDVVGPANDRRFRFVYRDGGREEIRPYLTTAQYGKARAFLKTNLPRRIKLFEADPPGIFAAIRGDF